MNMFIALFEKEISPEIHEDAKKHFGDGVFQFSERVLLIRSFTDNAAVVSEVLNLDGATESSNIGVVLRLDDSHSGYYYRSFWNWVKETRRMPVGRI